MIAHKTSNEKTNSSKSKAKTIWCQNASFFPMQRNRILKKYIKIRRVSKASIKGFTKEFFLILLCEDKSRPGSTKSLYYRNSKMISKKVHTAKPNQTGELKSKRHDMTRRQPNLPLLGKFRMHCGFLCLVKSMDVVPNVTSYVRAFTMTR